MNDWDKLREGQNHKAEEDNHRGQNNGALDVIERNPDGHQLIGGDFLIRISSDKVMVGPFKFMEVPSQEMNSVIYSNADGYADD